MGGGFLLEMEMDGWLVEVGVLVGNHKNPTLTCFEDIRYTTYKYNLAVYMYNQ